MLKDTDRQSWRWTNWSRLARLLETGPAVGRMGEDLLALLWRKGLKRFDGFTGEQERLDESGDFWFFDGGTAELGRFTGFANLLGPGLLTELPRPLFTIGDTTARRRGTRSRDSARTARENASSQLAG